ncbi:unnamed protein product [Peniophora sp. CBMAI 1063]|nr:unnamed protein product [Peniophora sp. CBMAI 1063]
MSNNQHQIDLPSVRRERPNAHTSSADNRQEPMWLGYARDVLEKLHYEELVQHGAAPNPEKRAHLAHALRLEADGFSSYLKACAQSLVSPISRLPPEILASIFLFVAMDDPPRKRYFPSQEPSRLGWVRISHVSKLWRSLCLRTPDLWALHVAILPDALTEFLERAGDDVPLDIHLELENVIGYQHDFQELILLHSIKRIRRMKWSTLHGQTFDNICACLQDSALPTLETLALDLQHTPSRDHDFSHRLYDHPVYAPRLTSISFTNCFIPLIAPTLTYLYFEKLQLPSKFLLALLLKVPLLEEMELHSCTLSIDFTGCAIVPLPRLESLTLWRDADARGIPAKTFKTLMEHLSFPPRTYLYIAYECPDSAEDLGYIESSVKSIWREDPPFGVAFDGFNLTLYSGPLPHPDQSSSYPFDYPRGVPRPDIRASLYACANWQFAQGLTRCLRVQDQFANLTVFSASMSHWNSGDWALVFQAVPNVHTLHLYHDNIVHHWCSDDEVDAEIDDDDANKGVFLTLASPSTPGVLRHGRSRIILPHLDILWLTRKPWTIPHGVVNERRLLRYLSTMIRSRAALSARQLSTLRLDIIKQPRMDQTEHGHASMLQGLVSDVRWKATGEERDGSGDEMSD